MALTAAAKDGMFQQWLEGWKSHLEGLRCEAANRTKQNAPDEEQTIVLTKLTVTMVTEGADYFRLAFRITATGTLYESFANREGVLAVAALLRCTDTGDLLPLTSDERRLVADWLLRYTGRK